MDKKLIKESFVEIAGKISEPLVDILDEKKYMSEFLVAKKLDLPINQTRNLLYKISERGIVSSTRKKDKKKGWYTYSWKIEALKALEFLKSMIEKRMMQIQSQINNRETREFYVCERCHIEFNEENALLRDFTCPECGGILELKDNTKLIKEMKKSIGGFEEMIKGVDEEIEKVQSLEAKKIRAKEAAEKREKARKKLAARAAREKERAKLKTKKISAAGKKVSKKKPSNPKTKSVKSAAKKSKTAKKSPAKKSSAKKGSKPGSKAKPKTKKQPATRKKSSSKPKKSPPKTKKAKKSGKAKSNSSKKSRK